MEKLTGKVILSGKITTLTGLHIGGSSSALDIGGIDLNVIKTAAGLPFIPGSSIKGKLRNLLARKAGSPKVEDDPVAISRIFGTSGDKSVTGPNTRLSVRDAMLDKKAFAEEFGNSELEYRYTEGKWENTIDRTKGSAKNPRQLERVPAGAEFCFEMVYDIYEDGKRDEDLKSIIESMRLLEDDYLGGSGSRGYGKIKFSEVKLELRDIKEYYEKEETVNDFNSLDSFAKEFNQGQNNG
ncbi:MAG: type III-A CRISPR-associated RAMP protein Csm3 [Bacteroidales bacterium]|nr:type III-A CRISPR-associated RAMP protein Csm3 [Bacteroidales bacterium]